MCTYSDLVHLVIPMKKSLENKRQKVCRYESPSQISSLIRKILRKLRTVDVVIIRLCIIYYV